MILSAEQALQAIIQASLEDPEFVIHFALLLKAPLKSFAENFVGRGMHLQYGIGILHRHTTLLDGTGMVHSALSDNIDICNIQKLDDCERSLTYNSLLLNKSSEFQAFDCDIGKQRPELDSEFLLRLKYLIIAVGLAQSVGIDVLPLID